MNPTVSGARCVVAALALGIVFAPAGGGPAHAQATAPYDIQPTRNVMVAARDGVHLATDVYLPARNGMVNGPLPAIVERTPYNKDSGADAVVKYFVPRGYAVVYQDIRGRYRSEGHWRAAQDDGPDGADLLKWIVAQPWSNGKIGTVGTSYAGSTQHAIAIANAPGLAAMVPVDAMSDYGRFGIRHNGAFELRWFNWILTIGNAAGVHATATGVEQTPNGTAAARRAAENPEAASALLEMATQIQQYVTRLPLRPGTTPLKFAPDYEKWLVEAMSHGDYDSFWENLGSSVIDHVAEYQDVPAWHFTGWYDSWGAQVANLNFVQLAKAKHSLQRLTIGPWTHGGQAQTFAGIADFGATAAVDMNQIRQRWFDRWLLNQENGIDREPPVRIFVMGTGDAHKTAEGRVFVGGVWRDEREWPLARTVYTPFYFNGDGRLTKDTAAVSAPTRYQFDPHNPVPTLGGNVSSEGILMTRGAQDQRCSTDYWACKDSLPLSTRSDVVVFQSAPLDSDVEVTGPVVVKLWAASDGPDTDFTAKLIDVYPPSRDFPAGIDLNVGDSIVRGRYRESLKTARMLVPNQPAEFTIELYPTSLIFRRGHRIRVDISSSNFPRFDVNPNTGEPLNGNRRWRLANNSIYHDPQHPSRVILPIIPGADRRTNQ